LARSGGIAGGFDQEAEDLAKVARLLACLQAAAATPDAALVTRTVSSPQSGEP
jgi:hypothetical protein